VENGAVTVLEAIAAKDGDTLNGLFAEDVVFHSPVQSYRGRRQVVHLLVTVGGILDAIAVTREVDGVTFFAAEVEQHPVDGVVVEEVDEDGRVAEITLMLRPLAQLQAAVARLTRALAAP
jgi:hypothetical protein